MAKHRASQPQAARNVAKTALVGGAITAGFMAVAVPANAEKANIDLEGFGLGSHTVELPEGVTAKDIPAELKGDVAQRAGVRRTVGQRAVAAAESKIGSPYSYGAAGPNAFDCSGLVHWSYKQAGRTIPRDSYGQLGGGRPVASLAQAKPGDVLIFNGGGHAGIYAGNGTFIHSSTYGVPVKRDKVKAWSLTGIRRY